MSGKSPSTTPKSKHSKLDRAAVGGERLGLDEFVELLNSPSRIAFLNLRAGFWRGIGFTLGAAVIVVVVGALVYYLGGLPYIGDFLNKVNSVIQSTH